MSKKVLIISASPRVGGNSDILCDQFAKGAKEKGIVYGTGAWAKGDIIGMPAMNDAYEMGKNI